MSPEALKCNVSIAFVTVAIGIVGTVLGAGITWGSSLTRLTAAEKALEAHAVKLDSMLQMQLSVIRIEQAVTDISRRLEKIEK